MFSGLVFQRFILTNLLFLKSKWFLEFNYIKKGGEEGAVLEENDSKQ